EGALREIQGYQHTIQVELETAADPRPLLELQALLSESQHARQSLEKQLEETRRELESLRSGMVAKESEFQAKAKELNADQVDVEEKVRMLTEALKTETERRQRAEQQAAETARRQSQMEAELIGVRNAQEEVQQQLEKAQKELET